MINNSGCVWLLLFIWLLIVVWEKTLSDYFKTILSFLSCTLNHLSLSVTHTNTERGGKKLQENIP